MIPEVAGFSKRIRGEGTVVGRSTIKRHSIVTEMVLAKSSRVLSGTHRYRLGYLEFYRSQKFNECRALDDETVIGVMGNAGFFFGIENGSRLAG